MNAAQPVPQRPLGCTALFVPALAFGAGPVSALMTDVAARDRQLATIQQALALGVDWFDAAATYGNGASEVSLGRVLRELGATSTARIGTKVRLAEADLSDITGAVRRSVEGSVRRLGVTSVALLQLHNSVTRQRGDQSTSITPDDVLRSDGVLAAFEQLRREGLVQHFGLTGLGDVESLSEVLRAGAWTTMQVNLNLCDAHAAFSLSPIGGEGRGEEASREEIGSSSSLRTPPPHPNPTHEPARLARAIGRWGEAPAEPEGRSLLQCVRPQGRASGSAGASPHQCVAGSSAETAEPRAVDSLPRWGRGDQNLRPTGPSLLAIRVFAGGALAGRPPSAHTLTTKFFPLAGYERDLRRAEACASCCRRNFPCPRPRCVSPLITRASRQPSSASVRRRKSRTRRGGWRTGRCRMN